MKGYTNFTKLHAEEATFGKLTAVIDGAEELEVTKTAAAAASTAPTKAEFDAVVDLCLEMKTVLNTLLAAVQE